MVSLLIFVSCQTITEENIFIRLNQVGFLPNDNKTAVVLSKIDLKNKNYKLAKIDDNSTVFTSAIVDSAVSYGAFPFCYELDFSSLRSEGNYILSIESTVSYPFKIGSDVYNPVRDSLSLFFRVQRCGPTNPILHQPCHLSDATKVIGDNDSSAVDLTGGWHDAGDYIKFLKTTAFTTYMLLFSYEFDKYKFSYDLDKNEIPDILEEAKVGIDWLLRCHYKKNGLISQVQDKKDHNVGWRLPEKDTLQFNRPAFASIGKNTIGMYVAALSIASRIWKTKFYDDEFANQCLETAKEIYSLRQDSPDIDSVYSNDYPESNYEGKLALGAIELYISTNDIKYRKEAVDYADAAKSDYWWSYGNTNSLAHYRLGKIFPEYSKFIFQNLIYSNQNMVKNLFRESLDYSWGTTNSFLGIALQAILYKDLTKSNKFDSLLVFQRDFILGRNLWGMSFIYNIGSKFPVNLHSQIAHFNNGYHPGALVGGPIKKLLLDNYGMSKNSSNLNLFNQDSLFYSDDKENYLTNEPTLVGNVTALFVFGCLSGK